MTNDNRKNPDKQEPRQPKQPSPESYPGNPNKQKQDTPRQQQADHGAKRDHSRLHEDRSVTDRTTRKTVIDLEDDQGEIDALKG